jgi:hypothetical protein
VLAPVVQHVRQQVARLPRTRDELGAQRRRVSTKGTSPRSRDRCVSRSVISRSGALRRGSSHSSVMRSR